MQYGEPIETPHFVDVTGRKIVVYVDWARSKCFSAFWLRSKCLVDSSTSIVEREENDVLSWVAKIKVKKKLETRCWQN